MTNANIRFAYFGTSEFAVNVLDELKTKGFLPTLIVTTEDKPKGRKLVLTPPPVKVWATLNNIKYIQPKTLRTPEFVADFKSYDLDLSIVASYGKIIPKDVIEAPKFKTLNVHPSLLPKLRGSSPIQSAILSEDKTGVTIMKIDELVDHGPILSQKDVEIDWPPYADVLEKVCGKQGGEMLSEILPKWINGEVQEIEQDHEKATFTKKIEKSDGEIKLSDDPEVNLRKIRAFNVWPSAFFFDDEKRIVIKSAHIENNELILEKVVPEGKKEMNYKDYLRGKK
jgi:methionyl-tRNA formyltransferase